MIPAKVDWSRRCGQIGRGSKARLVMLLTHEAGDATEAANATEADNATEASNVTEADWCH